MTNCDCYAVYAENQLLDVVQCDPCREPDLYGQLRWFSVLYDYPSWDRNYRPQRGVRVEARGEQQAARKALADAPAGSKILRCQQSRRQV